MSPPFESELVTRYLPKKQKDLVEKRFVYEHPEHGRITVQKGFETDFDSVVRIPVAYWLLKNRTRMAAVVHDWLYHKGKIRGQRIERDVADRIFLDAMKDEGVWWWRRRAIYAGVRFGGWKAWNDHREAEKQRAA